MKSERAFTVVEIMIVLLLVGILAAIAVPQFGRARDNARTNTCLNNLRQIQAAKDQAGIQLSLSESSVPTAAQVRPFLKGNEIPAEPLSGSSNSYGLNAISVNPTCAVTSSHSI